jgi:putative peptide zinc metalloprotease protein
MSTLADDLSRLLLRVRSDAAFIPQPTRAQRRCIITVPSPCRAGLTVNPRLSYFRIGYAEYVFISLLDGRTSFAEALAVSSQALGKDALSQSHASEICLWLIEQEIAEIVNRPARRELSKPETIWQRLNPFWTKIPLGSPQAWLDRGERWIERIISVPLLVLMTLFMLVAGVILCLYRTEFTRDCQQVLDPNNWLWLGLCWVGLKGIHEVGHAIACKRFGGSVREAGVVLILGAPLAYVDVTSAWGFASKWKRIAVACAGIFVELFIASLAVFLWRWTDHPQWSQCLCNLIVMATLTTILFNINPLMRYDGYFILIDLLNAPNLYQRAGQIVRGRFGRWYLGAAGAPERRGWGGHLLMVYGIAVLAWRIVVGGSLIVGASMLLKGWGILLSLCAIALWWCVPVLKWLGHLKQLSHEEPRAIIRCLVFGAATILSGFLLCFVVPWPGRIVAPGIVEYAGDAAYHSPVNGFIRRVYKADGALVEPGDLLMELDNPEREHELKTIITRIDQALANRREALDDQAPATAQIVERHLQVLRERHLELESQVQALTVRAHRRGRLIARRWEDRLGTYVERGEELFTIGNEEEKRVLVSLDQESVEGTEFHGRRAYIRVGLGHSLRGTVERVTPRASTELPHPALSALAGGTLAVRQTTEDQHEPFADGGSTVDSRQFELLDPRFKLFVSLDAEEGKQVQAGNRCTIHLGWQARRWLSLSRLTKFVGQALRFP